MNISIFKYDPSVDAQPYYAKYDVPYKDKMTVLEAITYAHEHGEAVMFDYSCHGRYCGRCSVMLDGEPVLACSTPLTDADHTIEPLRGMRVIRDLIVDRSDFDDRLSKQYQRIRFQPVKEEEIDNFDPAAAAKIYNMVDCTRCGVCNAGCPVFNMSPDKYVGPATMLAIAYRHLDSYDQADRVLEAVNAGLYRCIMCGKCDEVCPRYEIEHVKAWQMLRDAAEERGLKPDYAT